MGQTGTQIVGTVDDFVLRTIQNYRSKLLDLSSRNPLINFRHSERSRSHIRIVDEIPEKLYAKLAAGRQLSFTPLSDPELTPRDESLPFFVSALHRAMATDEAYRKSIAELGRDPSDRQKHKVERELRNRIRNEIGLPPFEPVTDPKRRAQEIGIDPEYDLPRDNGQNERRYNDLKLQTLFYREDSDRKLGGLANSARVLLQDAGLSALFCAFGFLEYYESAASDELRVAPLVFFPVDMDRVLEGGEYTYFIRTRNEDTETNVALAELLRQQYALELPAWLDAEDDSPPLERYFRTVEQMISGRDGWRLRRYVTVGLFTFSTLAMYKDLDPQRWTATPLQEHDVVRTLIAGAEVHDNRFAEEYDVDKLPGPGPFLITDADSSQHSAVIDVLSGKNCVIQGPPGTGKSQTITNIISAALHAGKSVLFVAEKMAALDVVKKRLDAAGLDRFCLELHSSKTAKSAVVASLADRLEFSGVRLNAMQLQSNAEALQRARKELLYYVEKANESAGSTGLRVCDVLLGSAIRDELRNRLPQTVANARFPNPLEKTPHVRKEMIDAARVLQEHATRITATTSLAKHPWRGLQNAALTDFEIEQLIPELNRWTEALNSARNLAALLFDRVGLDICATTMAINETCRVIDNTPDPPATLIMSVFRHLFLLNNRERLAFGLKQLEEVEATKNKTRRDFLRGGETVAQLPKRKEIAQLEDVLAKQLALQADATVGSLPEIFNSWQMRHAEVVKLGPGFATLLRSFRLNTEELGAAHACLIGVGCIGALERDLWALRSAELIDAINGPIVQEANSARATLKRRQTTLAQQVDMSLLPTPQELRRLAVALKSTNFILALFNRECRTARKLARAISRDNVKRNRQAIADLLLTCAQFIEDKVRFETDTRYNKVFGVQFRGIDTDFDSLTKVHAWAGKVEKELAACARWGPSVKACLFTATLSDLESINALTQSVDPIRKLTTLFETNDCLSLSELSNQELHRCQLLEAALSSICSTSIRPETKISGLPQFAACLAILEERTATLEGDPDALKLVGGSVAEGETNLAQLRSTLSFAEQMSASGLGNRGMSEVFDDVTRLADIKNDSRAVGHVLADIPQAAECVHALADINPQLWLGVDDFGDADVSALIQRNKIAVENRDCLQDYLAFLLSEDTACDLGLGPLLKAFEDANEDYSLLSEAAEMVFYRSAAEQILNADPRLKRHSGTTHDQLRVQFQQLDREFLEIRRKLLASDLLRRPVPYGNAVGRVSELTQMALVQHLSGQTRPRIALRDLFRRAGDAIKSLMPCWMMSPMSVAQFLQPGAIEFDLVLMDEASQIRPEEGFGAVIRGKQLVVVGDQMQLPPTPFFQKLSVDGGSDSEDEEFADVKQESILEAAAARFFPPRRLKWHYRSEHGSLISFSNKEFYNDDLVVFPSPFDDHPDYGVKLVQVNGVYKSGINTPEVTSVIEHAAQFMREHRDRSLGIVAVNSKQAELIREQLDKLFAMDPTAEAYRSKWSTEIESVFVKNLENVQGDERDVIFISTVYGKDDEGNFYQRFGPINSDYGHRRLNVLFTRAKKMVVLFTSMIPEDIEHEGKKWGVRALRGYLQYARDGHSTLAERSHAECDSEFETWVLEVLKAHGYDAVPQVGFAGYRIDIAVRHPHRPGIFVCGIECDGASYHSARSVRERDRLRQEVLERLHWKIYRIWSTDWFRNPATQTKNLLSYIDRLSAD
jgi:very-short-patch-repair endonuclease/nuclear transport factor 2 (NTF2) superfamily protein